MLALSILALISCNKKEEEDDPVSGVDSKDTLSSWAVSNGAWAVRLDLNGANLLGNQFTMVVKCSDNSEIHCTQTELIGSEGSGSWETKGTCTTPNVTPDSMAESVNGTGIFASAAGGSYTNDGQELELCRGGAGCNQYE